MVQPGQRGRAFRMLHEAAGMVPLGPLSGHRTQHRQAAAYDGQLPRVDDRPELQEEVDGRVGPEQFFQPVTKERNRRKELPHTSQ